MSDPTLGTAPEARAATGWGVWLGVITGALGWLLVATALLRGGDYLALVVRLAFVMPLAAVGTLTAVASAGLGRRSSVGPVVWLAAIAAFGAVWNVLVYWVHFGGETWGLLVPLAKPTGFDFLYGLYRPAQEWSTAQSGWPPLTLVLGKPFALLPFGTAHAVQVVIICALAVASVALGAVLAARAAGAPGGLALTSPRVLPLALVGGLWLFTSAGFMYQVERANLDFYALFFMLLAVWLMLGRRSPWWPALALAVATDLKVYPGVLFALLFWRYRLRALLPALVCGVALLLVVGPGAVADSVHGRLAWEAYREAYWWGNHSAAALGTVLHDTTAWAPSWLNWPLIVVPILLWLATLALLVRRGWSDRSAVLATAACFPVMSVVPGTSHDYKLVICVVPLMVLVALLALLWRRGALAWASLFLGVAWAMVQLSRASLVIAPSFQNSKYFMIVLLQAVLLAVVVMTDNGTAVAVATGETTAVRPPSTPALGMPDGPDVTNVAPPDAAEEETT